MRTNRNNENAINEFNKLYMSFEIEQGYQDDIMESVLDYAMKACAAGPSFIKKNRVSCKKANDCSVFWEYEPAEQGDWYCKFCCGMANSNLVVNGFVNSHKDEDQDTEVYYVRIALGENDRKLRSDLFRSHSGYMRNGSQAQSFDNLWIDIIGGDDMQIMKYA